MKTKAQQITEDMQAQGYRLAGKTSGWLSFRKGSNLAGLIEVLGLTESEVIVKCGAKEQHATEGTELLVFVKAQ